MTASSEASSIIAKLVSALGRPLRLHGAEAILSRDPIENPEKAYRFVTNCLGACCGRHIQEMVDDARQVSYETMRRNCADMDEVVAGLGYDMELRRRGLKFETDPGVAFFSSIYRDIPCYYFTHSAVEYIFTLGGRQGTPCIGQRGSSLLARGQGKKP